MDIHLTVDSQSGVTIAEQIRQQLIWLITSGQLLPGQPLPSIRQLAFQTEVNLHTIRKVYLKLEEDGFVRTNRGKRAVVAAYTAASLAGIAGARRSHTIGVILPNLANPFYHQMLEGVDEIAGRDGCLVFVCSSRENPELVFRYLAQLSARHVDGIIVVSQDLGVKLPRASKEDGRSTLPIVMVDWPEADTDVVLLDLENAGYLATRHLVEHGHRRVGLLTVNKDAANITPVNLGYAKAMREFGIEPDTSLVVRTDGFDLESGAAGMLELLGLSAPPTAVFAISDTLAFGAMRTLRKRGLRIPGDVALTSFNDTYFAELADPPLTTVAVPVREMGLHAMKMLQEMIADSVPVERKVVFQASLVIRQSCGCKGSTCVEG